MELSPLFCGRLVGTRTRDLYRVKVGGVYQLRTPFKKTNDLGRYSLDGSWTDEGRLRLELDGCRTGEI
jgi:hypothetical protein